MKSVFVYLWHCLTLPFRVSFQTWKDVRETNRIERELQAALERTGRIIRVKITPGDEVEPGDLVAYNEHGEVYRVKGGA